MGPTHLPKPLPNPDTDTTLTDMVIPLMLVTDSLTITAARGLLSPLLLPNPDTDTTVTDTDTTLMAILDSDTTDTITARDLLSPPLSPDTPTTLMPPILMPTMATMVILMAVMVITTKFCCLTISRLCHTKIGEF